MKLPKPKHKRGYPESQIKEIFKGKPKQLNKFWEFMRGQTCTGTDTEPYECVIYPCDVENFFRRPKDRFFD